MRYMVFGDVHGNLLALETALAAAQRLGVEAYLFVGDLVGYGPEPLECIARLRELQRAGRLAWVAGNHELAVRGEGVPGGISEEADQTLRWTRQLVERTPWAKEFLAAAPLTLGVDDRIWLAHDSLAFPNNGRYHRTPRQANSELACLRHYAGRACFYGHTHVLRAELLRDDQIWLSLMQAVEPTGRDPQPLRLATDALGWVGTGSVGFPTNPGRRAEFLILDDADREEWRVEKYAMAYPREEVRARTQRILRDVCAPAVVERIIRWL